MGITKVDDGRTEAERDEEVRFGGAKGPPDGDDYTWEPASRGAIGGLEGRVRKMELAIAKLLMVSRKHNGLISDLNERVYRLSLGSQEKGAEDAGGRVGAGDEAGVGAVAGRRGTTGERERGMAGTGGVGTDEMIRDAAAFVALFEAVQKAVHGTAVRNGFWNGARNDGEKIALMHSELSEALEALRKGNSADDKLPEFEGAAVELADCVIRIMDFAQARNLDVAGALVAKAVYNRQRPFRHGKAF